MPASFSTQDVDKRTVTLSICVPPGGQDSTSPLDWPPIFRALSHPQLGELVARVNELGFSVMNAEDEGVAKSLPIVGASAMSEVEIAAAAKPNHTSAMVSTLYDVLLD